jgi:beta-lactam-binding protein with PASTA domain
LKRFVLTATALLLLFAGCGGSGKTVVPELRGKPEKQAGALLHAHHLCPSPEPAAWSSAAKAHFGTVVDQDPTPGTRIDRDSEVRIWVRERPDQSGKLTFVDSTC